MASQLVCYNLDGHHVETISPSYETVIEAFNLIDSHWRLTFLVGEPGQLEQMSSVMGCLEPADRLCIMHYCFSPNDVELVLVDSEQLRSTKTVEMANAMDMTSHYPIWESVTRDTAFKVVESLARSSKIPDGLVWKDMRTGDVKLD